MVGDRLYTDILIGIHANTLTTLVLTGEAKLTDLDNTPIKPDIIAKKSGWVSRFNNLGYKENFGGLKMPDVYIPEAFEIMPQKKVLSTQSWF